MQLSVIAQQDTPKRQQKKNEIIYISPFCNSWQKVAPRKIYWQTSQNLRMACGAETIPKNDRPLWKMGTNLGSIGSVTVESDTNTFRTTTLSFKTVLTLCLRRWRKIPPLKKTQQTFNKTKNRRVADPVPAAVQIIQKMWPGPEKAQIPSGIAGPSGCNVKWHTT